MGFVGDNYRGKRGENLIAGLLMDGDIECELNEDRKTNIFYDIEFKIGRKKYTIEVKCDYMAQKTGNIAIEYFNSKKGTHSGVYATKADIWAHCLMDGDNLTVWITHVDALKKFIQNEEPVRLIERGGDDNADLMLFKEDHILSIFTRIDNLIEKDIAKAVKKVLKYEK